MTGRPALPRPSLATAIGVAVAGGYLVATLWAVTHVSFDVAGGVLLLPLVTVVVAAAFYRAARGDDDPWLARATAAIIVAKLVGTLARYAVIFVVYGGESDARQFDETGKLLAASFRNLDFAVDVGKVPGTGFMDLLSGAVYTVLGPTRVGAFLFFSMASLAGTLLLYRAFRLAMPTADHRRYGLLLFFLPSMLFWPSSTGKEAWMLLTMGASAYGAAQLFRRRPAGLIVLSLGLAGAAMLRPHVALALVLALVVAYALRRPDPDHAGSPLGRAVVFAALVAGAIVLVSSVESFFNVDSLDRESVEGVLARTEERNVGDRSSFDAIRINSPLDIPGATITVLFRPFPFEADTVQAFGSGIESLLLLGFIVVSAPRIVSALRRSGRSPYLLFALVFLALFVYAFSSFGNFGLLARQRVQALPFLLALLALPRAAPGRPPPAPLRNQSVTAGAASR